MTAHEPGLEVQCLCKATPANSAAVTDSASVLDNPMTVVGTQTNASNGVRPNAPRRSLPHWAGQEDSGGDGVFVLATRPASGCVEPTAQREVAFHLCIALSKVDRALRSSMLTNRRRRNMIFVNPNALTEGWRARMPPSARLFKCLPRAELELDD
jgi:hypothetical protein